MRDNLPRIQVQRCSNGTDCINSAGPFLPANMEYFYLQKNRKCGISARCKECSRAYGRKRGAEMREKNRDANTVVAQNVIARNAPEVFVYFLQADYEGLIKIAHHSHTQSNQFYQS